MGDVNRNLDVRLKRTLMTLPIIQSKIFDAYLEKFDEAYFGGNLMLGDGEMHDRHLNLVAAATKPSLPPAVSAPPGHLLLGCADFVFPRRCFEEVLQPAVEDMRCEYNDALVGGRTRKAMWVRVRGTWSFFYAAGLIVVGSFGKIFVRIVKLIG